MGVAELLILVAIVCFVVSALPTSPQWPWLSVGLVFFAAAHAVGSLVR